MQLEFNSPIIQNIALVHKNVNFYIITSIKHLFGGDINSTLNNNLKACTKFLLTFLIFGRCIDFSERIALYLLIILKTNRKEQES